jgi:hypothetical protein
VEGVESITLSTGIILAELSQKPLYTTIYVGNLIPVRPTSSTKKKTHGIGEDTTETGRIIAKEHISNQHTEAGEEQHRGHHRPRRTLFSHRALEPLAADEGGK